MIDNDYVKMCVYQFVLIVVVGDFAIVLILMRMMMMIMLLLLMMLMTVMKQSENDMKIVMFAGYHYSPSS